MRFTYFCAASFCFSWFSCARCSACALCCCFCCCAALSLVSFCAAARRYSTTLCSDLLCQHSALLPAALLLSLLAVSLLPAVLSLLAAHSLLFYFSLHAHYPSIVRCTLAARTLLTALLLQCLLTIDTIPSRQHPSSLAVVSLPCLRSASSCLHRRSCFVDLASSILPRRSGTIVDLARCRSGSSSIWLVVDLARQSCIVVNLASLSILHRRRACLPAFSLL
jgi:hypothetical protein